MFDKSSDDASLNMIHRRSFETEAMPARFALRDFLEVTKEGFTAVATYTMYNGQPTNFFGTPVPDVGQYGEGTVIYTVTFGTNQGQFVSLNDISGTHNITHVIENSVLVDRDFIASDISVGYCVFDSSENIPALGTIIPETWNLWQMNGGLYFIDIEGTRTVKIDNFGRKYIDIFTRDPNGNGSTPESKDYFNYKVIFAALSDTNLSISENEIPGFKMYPNPVRDVLNFKADVNISEVRVYDILGREVGVFTNGVNAMDKIDITTFPAGTYILKIVSNKTLVTKKFIKI